MLILHKRSGSHSVSFLFTDIVEERPECSVVVVLCVFFGSFENVRFSIVIKAKGFLLQHKGRS